MCIHIDIYTKHTLTHTYKYEYIIKGARKLHLVTESDEKMRTFPFRSGRNRFRQRSFTIVSGIIYICICIHVYMYICIYTCAINLYILWAYP
jgi:hypothetical protein